MEILGCTTSATSAEIKRLYKSLSMRTHPDKAAPLWSLGCATAAFFGAGV